MSTSLLILINSGDRVTSQVMKFGSKAWAEQAKRDLLEDYRQSVWAVRITLLEGTD